MGLDRLGKFALFSIDPFARKIVVRCFLSSNSHCSMGRRPWARGMANAMRMHLATALGSQL